jgi:hypothetical protein
LSGDAASWKILETSSAGESSMTVEYDFKAMRDCCRRELALRRNVYPKQIAAGRLSPAKADREIALMTAVVAYLEAAVSRGDELRK